MRRKQHQSTGGVRKPLTIPLILEWADEFYRVHGFWPGARDGRIKSTRNETWQKVQAALIGGGRGLKGKSSIFKLLKRHGRKRVASRRRTLTPEMILGWADAFFATHGYWPYSRSGPVAGVPRENWSAISEALRSGRRGLPGRGSLSRFLNEHRDLYRGRKSRPYRISEHRKIDMDKVMRWAKAYRRRTGIWPHLASGKIPGSGGYRWGLLDMALRFGRRGLPGGTSLSRLFGHKERKDSINKKKRVQQKPKMKKSAKKKEKKR